MNQVASGKDWKGCDKAHRDEHRCSDMDVDGASSGLIAMLDSEVAGTGGPEASSAKDEGVPQTEKSDYETEEIPGEGRKDWDRKFEVVFASGYC